MASVVIEDHGNQKYGLRITNDGRAQVDSDTTSNIERNLVSGKMFSVRRLVPIVADDNYLQLLLYTGTSGVTFNSKVAYIAVNPACGGDAILEIYENPTVTASGTQLDIYDKNRRLTTTPNSTAFHTPTVTASGTRLCHRLAPDGAVICEGGIVTDSPWALKANEDYLISLKNVSGNATSASLALTWIEKA